MIIQLNRNKCIKRCLCLEMYFFVEEKHWKCIENKCVWRGFQKLNLMLWIDKFPISRVDFYSHSAHCDQDYNTRQIFSLLFVDTIIHIDVGCITINSCIVTHSIASFHFRSIGNWISGHIKHCNPFRFIYLPNCEWIDGRCLSDFIIGIVVGLVE